MRVGIVVERGRGAGAVASPLGLALGLERSGVRVRFVCEPGSAVESVGRPGTGPSARSSHSTSTSLTAARVSTARQRASGSAMAMARRAAARSSLIGALRPGKGGLPP